MPEGFPARRAALLEAQDALNERHVELRGRDAAVTDQRQHRDALIEQRDALASFHADLASLPEAQQARLQLTRAAAEVDTLLTETLASIERGREAWKRATDAWQRVRDRLDQNS